MTVSTVNREAEGNMFYGAVPKLFEFAKILRLNQTKAEKLLWAKLSKKNMLGFRFRTQHPVKYFVADFYCHRLRLVIEVDGGKSRVPEEYEYDKSRDDELKKLGIKVLRFKSAEVLEDLDLVIDRIKAYLEQQSLPRISS